jgi:asparagine synthase (glutamine-hydrolysing)
MTIAQMLHTMRRRGPDGKGSYLSGHNTLLHTRLSIIDPSGGAQPMVLDYDNERYILTYNGELYNTLELRQELQRMGHVFYGHSDTEVLLHGYAQWKEEVLHKLNGIFAFGVLHEREGKVFMARDRIGVKPLFYMCHEGGFLFASEIKTILAYPGVRPQLDAQGAGELLLLGPGRPPQSGMFRNIRQLEPGCFGIWNKGKFSISRYWQLRDREHTDSFEETAEQVRWLVTDAINRQLVSDVPVGCFLSGGLDSSIICAIAAREMDSRGEYLPTFSVDYLDNDKYFVPGKFQPNSDTEYIRLMTDQISSDHQWTVLKPQELLDALEDATMARDLPGMADVDTSLLLLCKQIRPKVKVALSGECADEIFGGYPWYRDPAIRDGNGFPWSQNILQRKALLHPDLQRQMNAEEFVYSHYADTLKQCDILPSSSPTEKRMKQMVNLNFSWFMQTLLERKDRMSMYHGLEVRVPFCDWRIAEYLYAVPWEFKEYRGYEKGLLRYAMEGLLPQSVLFRKKSPYPKTWHPAYEKTAETMLRIVMEDKNAPLFGIISHSALERLLETPFASPWYGQLMQRPQTMVYLLQIAWWLEHYCVQIV